MPPRDISNRLVRLPSPRRGEGVFEPHVAIDPDNPNRAAAVAVYPSIGRGLGRGVWCWQTSDGGLTWEGNRIVQARFDGEGAADPLIGYAADGTLVAVAMTLPASFVTEKTMQFTSLTRTTSPGIEEVVKAAQNPARKSGAGNPFSKDNTTDMVCISRSDDRGRTWSSWVIPNSAGGDRTALAIDRHPSSPYCDNVYIAWCDTPNGQLAFARSVDAGRTTERAIRLGSRNGVTMAQIAIGPRGVIHLIWRWIPWLNGGDASVAAGLYYARSDDGGVTFNEPTAVVEYTDSARRGRMEQFSCMSLAIAPGGALLVVWSEVDAFPIARGSQMRTTIRWMRSEDGVHWSEPAQLADLPADTAQGLPAVTSTKSAWHVLAYDASPTRTTVRIYSASHNECTFRPTHEIAARNIGSEDIYLHGNYQLRRAHDVAVVGDYVGLSGAGSHLAAAIVLPETDEWRQSELVGYAAVLAEGDLR
jgi:hypothetical protein